MQRTGNRVANFTSSKIHALMSKDKSGKGFGKPALTYIQEKFFEERLGRSIDTESNAKPLSWGNLVEARAFEQLGLEYEIVSQDTIMHPTISRWGGSPDLIKHRPELIVCDIKCPITLKSFCIFHDCNTIEEAREQHDDGEKYYWQLVSNAVLTGARKAELIVYCPYKDELAEIREMASNFSGDQNKVAWINWANDDELPWLNRGGYYKNIKVIAFDIPQSDIDALTARVNLAAVELERMLNPAETVMLASSCPDTGAVIVENANPLIV